jgi:2-hydroxychromene-2-carboxylate isomerase
MTTPAPEIELFFDIGSSYSYLAFTQIDGIEQRTGRTVRARPFLLGGVFKATGNDMPARVAAKARYMITDMQRWSEEYGVAFALPASFPSITISTQRALVACDRLFGQAALRKLARALFDAYWARGQDVADKAVIAAVATACGLDAAAIVAGIDAQETKDRLRADTEEAVARGAFGAPTFFVGDQMFFGNDRIPHLERFVSPPTSPSKAGS